MHATIFTPGRICELYPQAVVAATQAGHEIADHMWEHRVPKERDLEYDHLVKSTQALERLTGRRPVGTRSHHTPAFLTQLGYIYTSTDTADHLPYYVADAPHQHMLLNLPFHYAIDDAMFFNFGWIGSGPCRDNAWPTRRACWTIWWEAFQHLYKQGSYLNICLHPFISGRALRTAMLDRFITRMQSLPGVWFTTCEERWHAIVWSIFHRRAVNEAGALPQGSLCTMPWKDGYTTSDEKSLADHEVIWPDGKQCACVIVVDLSVASGPEGITPADLTTAASQFGTQVGLRSLLDTLAALRHDRHLRRAGRHRRNLSGHRAGDPGARPRGRRARLQARRRQPARTDQEQRAP